VGRLAFRLALPTQGLFRHHRHSRPVHFYIQDWNWLTNDDRQIQLHGSLHLLTLARGDTFSNRFRRSLHGFGRNLQSGE
jgi:hypothetical protein